MSNNFSGFDDLTSHLNKMSKAAQELDGDNEIPMADLLTNSFISKNTSCQSLDEFFEKSGFDVSSEEAFAAIPDEDMDRFVSQNSNFNTWTDMLGTATQEYVAKKLGF
ncbi:hypothetical protein FOF38_04845 [Enterococcus faecium]|uniref:hypothetical protein n=1 Tax=Enterococcus TaxID=1350 RepID=UPI001C5B80BC|nr:MULTISPECIES: hypothetical protein [Enterococcus]QXX72684.1 hypothetical protein KU781_04635 [Enterococcus lactis]WLE20537.1 hypothetical protein FOF38_04845 [Enterococcus faecium]